MARGADSTTRGAGLRERLARDPSAWATIVRHLVPIAGVLFAGWSALEALAALFLDALSVLLCIAAVASTFVVTGLAHDEQDLLDRLDLLAGGVVIFLIVGGLLAFAIAVPGFLLWGSALRGGSGELWQLARGPSLQATFASMLACQVPRYWTLVTRFDAQSARRIVEPEVGFVLLRMILVGGAGILIGALPERASLLGALVAAQAVLASTEIMSDRVVAALGGPGDRAPRPGEPSRPRRRRLRR
ncbi:MAG: hypothetical protein AB1689_14030 [Thermodesulfobacteriota bacterium]